MAKIQNQRGSVFIYILVAIALFAGLSYAVSRGSRGGSTALTDEQAKLAAQEIINYGNTVANAVQKLRLRGCSDTEISFENSQSVDNYTNANAPSDNSCHVFDLAGGNITYTLIPDIALDESLSAGISYGQYRFREAAIDNVGSNENDLFLQPSNLKRGVCLEINNILGIDNPSGEPPSESHTAAALFTGTYAAPTPDNIGDDGGHNLSGKLSFCRNHSANYKYLQVLVTR